jgi:hypothetical protein
LREQLVLRLLAEGLEEDQEYEGRNELFSRLPHSTAIKDLTFAALKKAFCPSVKTGELAAKGLDRAHRAGWRVSGKDGAAEM